MTIIDLARTVREHDDLNDKLKLEILMLISTEAGPAAKKVITNISQGL